ncbi:hypothetical protein NKH77_27415 [Streptomyces sp. M19]
MTVPFVLIGPQEHDAPGEGAEEYGREGEGDHVVSRAASPGTWTLNGPFRYALRNGRWPTAL